MQRLKPLKVPWQVSPSTPFLRLVAAEPTETQIVFVSHFGLRAEETVRQEVGFQRPHKAADPYQMPDSEGEKSKTHSLVKLDFQGGLWARISPAFSDREVVNPQEFDDSLIPCSKDLNDVGAWLQNFRDLWIKTGNCPDPGVYTVESSQWVRDLGLTKFEHFLIQGHDTFIEVLARSWKWEEIKKLPDWW